MQSSNISIGQVGVGPDHPPFVIAEMSGNHNHSLDRALQLVDAAAAAGCQALKLQTYTADTMTLDIRTGRFLIQDEKSLWHGRNLYELYQDAHTPWDWHAPIFERARSHGMLAFSTPFDATAVDFLEKLEVPAYKVASFENTDLPLIRRVARTGKPLIISTGLASVAEIADAVAAARGAGCTQLILLKCTSAYPADAPLSNVSTIPHMRQLFGCPVGLSDHTLGIGAAIAAVALGACVIEKHFTLSRTDGGVDSAFSLEPAELQSLVTESRRAWQALGAISYGPTNEEMPSLQFRRTLHIAADVAPGESLTAANLRAIRPGGGLSPKYLEVFLGRTATAAIACGTPVTWDLLKNLR